MAQNWQNAQKEKTRQEILAAAATSLRKKGMRASSVAKVMKAAGLTVGGFYAHFRSKDHLVLESFRSLLQATGERIRAIPAEGRWSRYLSYYLSTEHRDHPEQGCPILPLIFEASSASKEFRFEFTQELESALKQRAEDFPTKTEEELLVAYSTMLGAQLLARASRGHPYSEKVLETVLRSMVGKN